ncbi:uncharacterized protein FIBRA_08931 [Fibroporia radiculosa]|uniref:Uncharacterized protein n=1 Tax=Fibroporia radiculosa TaxID=599839 RepID=J4GIJ1_9APHY|nr:uncharacterized protein FIBRA_08931 [Fibroporia radiculosa]CCM06648.1 predicted protein [Fibroporia radiculosa]
MSTSLATFVRKVSAGHDGGIQPRPCQVTVQVARNTFISVTGTSTAEWVQRVKVTVEGDSATYTLTANKGQPLKTDKNVEAVTLGPYTTPKNITLDFSAKPPGSDFKPAYDVRPETEGSSNQLTVQGIATAYVFHSEDGGDRDYHDTTAILSLVATTK